MILHKSTATLLMLLCLPVLPAQVAVHDLFNRTSSTNLGPDWTEVAGDALIQGNLLQGNNPFGFGYISHTTFSNPWSTTLIRAAWSMNGFGGDRVSVIAGNDVSYSGIEIRIADNTGDGLADRIFFNAAVNAGNWFGGSQFFDLPIPFASGVVTLWFTNGGDTANVEIKDNAGTNVNTFSAGGILTLPPTGTSVGVGFFGDARLDDFRAWVASAIPGSSPVYSASPLRVNQPSELLITTGLSLAPVLIGISTTGTGPIPTAIGNVALSPPLFLFPTVFTNATGQLVLPLGALPPSALGSVVHTQAVDLTTPALTNFFSVTVL